MVLLERLLLNEVAKATGIRNPIPSQFLILEGVQGSNREGVYGEEMCGACNGPHVADGQALVFP